MASIQTSTNRNFPGGPVVKTLLPLQGVWVRSLVGELRSRMLHGAAWPKVKKKKKKFTSNKC